MTAQPLSVAFVGAGNMIREHAKAFASSNSVMLSGITNRTRDKAEALAKDLGIKHVADDIEALWNATQADLVVMAVYEPAILETFEALAAKPWAILMEKPMGMDFDSAKRIKALAEQRDAPVFVGLNRRTLGSTRAALEDLNTIDAPRFIHVQDQQNLQAARNIGHAENVVQNWMFANSVHLADYLNTFGRGEITEVQVIEPWTPEAPERVLAYVSYSSGDRGVYEAQWNAPGPWACTVSTSERRWEMRPLEAASYQNAGERTRNDAPDAPEDKDFKPGFKIQAERVLASLRGEDSAAVKAEDAFKSMALVAKIYGRNGG